MYHQLSLVSNKRDPLIFKGSEVLARGMRVWNNGCSQNELASTVENKVTSMRLCCMKKPFQELSHNPPPQERASRCYSQEPIQEKQNVLRPWGLSRLLSDICPRNGQLPRNLTYLGLGILALTYLLHSSPLPSSLLPPGLFSSGRTQCDSNRFMEPNQRGQIFSCSNVNQ